MRIDDVQLKNKSFTGHGCRSTLELMFDVIEVCRTPIIMTHIMYKSNINASILKTYLKLLLEHEMLKIIPYQHKGKCERGARKTRTLYQSTKKGAEFLKLWDALVNAWKKEFLLLEDMKNE